VNVLLDHLPNSWEAVGLLAMRALARLDLYNNNVQVLLLISD